MDVMCCKDLRIFGWLLFGLSWLLVFGCVGNKPLRNGFPCRSDADCKGPNFQLFCGKNRVCKAESCADGASRKCFTGSQGCQEDGTNCKGSCEAGTQSCIGGFWSICTNQKLPQKEICDGKDNNCDGSTDETFPEEDKTCEFKNSSGQGIGAGGQNVCVQGKIECQVNQEVNILSTKQSLSMGTPDSDKSRGEGEVPTYNVDFGYNYALGQTEVTQKQFKDLMGYNPSKNTGGGNSDSKPVNNITWHEAAAYTVLLSRKNKRTPCFKCTPEPEKLKMEGSKDKLSCEVAGQFDNESQYVTDCNGYRLPTEAEWLNGYRAGENYKSYYNGNQVPPGESERNQCYNDTKLKVIAWYCNEKGEQPNEVKKKDANRWKLHDMSGNVEEWTFDIYTTDFKGSSQNRIGPKPTAQDEPRVVKGGSYESTPSLCRGAARSFHKPSERSPLRGFRVARTIQN